MRRHSVNMLASASLVLLAGCAESVLIKSAPPGAKAFVDGKYIGSTPAVTEIPRGEVTADHQWRVEFRNCEPAEGMLHRGIAGGRIVGYIFTAGFTAIFRGPYYFVDVDVPLGGGDCEGPGSAHALPAAPGITVQQIVGDRNAVPGSVQEGPTATQRLAERLTTLRDLYNRKLISQEIYEQETQKAVRQLGD